jgi:hypothetical protein
MKVVVWDDGGLIGVETALWVRDHGHEVELLSAPHGLDSYTREEVTEVLRACSVVIDLLCRPSLAIGTLTEDQGFVIDDEALVGSWLRSTRKLLQTATAAGVTYHVALSVAGVTRAASRGVFRALKARETMIQRSATPHFILRSTQMFESAEEMATAGTEDWIVWVPPVDVRPVALTDVAMLLAHTAVSRPRTGVHEIAGPEKIDQLDGDVGAGRQRGHVSRPAGERVRVDHRVARVVQDEAYFGQFPYRAYRGRQLVWADEQVVDEARVGGRTQPVADLGPREPVWVRLVRHRVPQAHQGRAAGTFAQRGEGRVGEVGTADDRPRMRSPAARASSSAVSSATAHVCTTTVASIALRSRAGRRSSAV